MRKVAVTGVGMTKFGRAEGSLVELFSQAAWEAIEDANIMTKEIQALFIGNVLGDFAGGQTNIGGFITDDLGLGPNVPATRFEGACATASVAVRNAFLLVAGGLYDMVLVGGVEKVMHMGVPLSTRTFAMNSDSSYEVFSGLTFPGMFGMATHLYAKKYNIPLPKLKEQMAMVAVKNHKNGTLNPKAQFRKEITVDDVLNSAMVCDPLQLYDCCPFTDGAAALVLTTEEIAKKRGSKPVYILGAGQGSMGALHHQRDYTVMQGRISSAQQAYKMAGLTPADVDVCELHDCFTTAEIIASECLGFFEFGKGSQAVEEGITSLRGSIPINPSGGLKAKGHPIGATGAAQVYEIVKQLRGECGERQVEGAKVGITDTLGGDAGTIVNIILGN
jgi:acetyl-CoA C-acetyltransferase/acetyl-CoA acyltransferase